MASATQSYRILKAIRATEPAAYWKDGILFITVSGEELDAVVLTEAEDRECEVEARTKQLALEKVRAKKRTRKAGKVKYDYLSRHSLIPQNPQLRSTSTTPAIPQSSQGSNPPWVNPLGSNPSAHAQAPSTVSSFLGGAKRFLGLTQPEQWVVEAFSLYNLQYPILGNDYTGTLSRVLSQDLVYLSGNQSEDSHNYQIQLRKEDLSAPDLSDPFTSREEQAFIKKKELLIRLGLISDKDTLSYRVSATPETSLNSSAQGQLSGLTFEESTTEEDHTAKETQQQPSEVKPAVIEQTATGYKITLSANHYQGPTYTEGSYWANIVQTYLDRNLGSSTEVILKEHLENYIEDGNPRKLTLIKADIKQQLVLDSEIQPGSRISSEQWIQLLVAAVGRKLLLALEVGAIQNPLEEFTVEVAFNFLTHAETEYYATFQEEELKVPATIMAPSPAAITNVELAADSMAQIRTRLADNANNPLDIDDIEHCEDLLLKVDATMKSDMDAIISTPQLTDTELTGFKTQKRTIVTEREDIQLVLNKLKRKINSTDPPIRPNRRGAAGASPRIQLPKVVIPTFQGEWDKWLGYKDTMVALVVDQPESEVPNIHKYQLLRQSLEGPALDVIKGIPMSSANFARAWKALRERYDNPVKLKAKYHHLIANVKKLDGPSAVNLRQLYDKLNNARESLILLGVPPGDEFIISQLVACMDDDTSNYYAMRTRSDDLDDEDPTTWVEMQSFIHKRLMALENVRRPAREERPSTSKKATAMTAQYKDTTKARPQSSSPSCLFCHGPHGHWICDKFKQKSIDAKREFVQEKRLCFNCLSPKHTSKFCQSKSRCRECHSKHHTLLHVADRRPQGTRTGPEVQANTAECISPVILPTARIWVQDVTKELLPFRALMDTGSQSNFISERALQHLRLKRSHTNVQVTGIGHDNSQRCKGKVTLEIQSMVDSSVKLTVQALVLPQVAGHSPSCNLPPSNWKHLQDLQLADPDFGSSNKIDILLGADVVFQCLTGMRMTGHPQEPIAHSTTLRWIVGGCSESLLQSTKVSAHLAIHPTVPISVLHQFWGGEGLSEEVIQAYQKKEDVICEQHFMASTTRLEDGKLQVKFPFRNEPPNLGASKDIAIKRLAGTEARLARNPDLRRQYEEFLQDYEDQGHMEASKDWKDTDVFLPHHPIVRTTALTTKLRVVFDASCKTTNNKSLNDEQLVGPVIQDDLFSILTRFRLHKVAINGDITQMYRQIWIHPDHQDYQCILWRRKPTDPITKFRLKTVTYGTASAPWLATRSLKWIADRELDKHPEAAKIIQEDHYMDDLLSGADSPEDAHRIQNEVSKILLSYGLPLRKWASNDEWVIRAISGDQEMLTNPEDIIKTLGLKWNSKEDAFQFKVKLKEFSKLTKREMISEIACTFDPLGFVAPVMVKAKILYQKVWATTTDWDDPLPEDIARTYKSLRQQLGELESIALPRWLGTLTTDNLELHGFSDASEKAYGAAVYLRVTNSNGTVSNLVAAKTRVAPLSTASLPRLELMGAVLLTELMQKVTQAYRRPIHSKYYWTDSTITLAWIQGQPGRFKTFVANRIAAIQEGSNKEDWNHVRTNDNPADLASRGIMPHELTGSIKEMWFHGPTWFRTGDLPVKMDIPTAQEELKKIQVLHAACTSNSIEALIAYRSSFNRLWRVTAWILRFIGNCRSKTRQSELQLSAGERQTAILKLIAVVQQKEWPNEIRALTKGESTQSEDTVFITNVMKKSNISNLNPMMDSQGILRVGGRLRYSNQEFEAKHPALLPYGHFATIYLRDIHHKALHAGPTLLLATARQSVWIIHGPQLAKQIVKQCVTCQRWRADTLQQQMGDLPTTRTEGLRAFNVVGVDYAGPMSVKTRKGRGGSTSKAWISLFVCFTTKAIHLELVSDLTTEAFIAALRRFISRRGVPREVHSDNGTNFVGAARELRELLEQEKFQQDVANIAIGEGITWKFIPPSAPHQGGLWEAGVKSVKHHLRRVMGATSLTYEEFSTVLCQIEAQLNSRPLRPLTEDTSELNPLTPGHFLIGQALTTAPDPSLAAIKENRLSRFQYLQRLQQEFWRKWHLEYLSSLQKRNKWKYPQEDIKLDALVLIKEDNTAPTQWRRGRVIELQPSKDGKTRVVKLRTSQGEVARPIVKLIPLI